MCVTLATESLLRQNRMQDVFLLAQGIYQYKRAYLMFHDHHNMPHFISHYDKLVLRNDEDLNLGFDKRVKTLLPSPYATDCYHYSSSSGHKSQKECLFEYMSRKELKTCGYNYFWNRRHFDVSKERFRFTRYEKRCHFDVNHEWLNRVCKPDCDITEYSVKQMFYTNNTLFVLRSVIYKFSTYYIRTTTVPKINLIEYLSTLGGLFSMWLGFTVWFLIDKIFKLFEIGIRVHKKRIVKKIRHLIKSSKYIEIIRIFCYLTILAIMIYQIGRILHYYLYFNKHIIISQKIQVRLPKVVIDFVPFINFADHEHYYPGITSNFSFYQATDKMTFYNILNNHFRMMIRDNLTLFMQLQRIDQAIIKCQVEYQSYNISCPQHRALFYLSGNRGVIDVEVTYEILPRQNQQDKYLLDDKEKIRKFSLELRNDKVYETTTIWFRRQLISAIPNNQWFKVINPGKINNYVIKTNSVQRLQDFEDKPCIHSKHGVLDNEVFDECIMDCINHMQNTTYGCLPIVNAWNYYIRIERDLKLFGFDFCRYDVNNKKIFYMYRKCAKQCPSSCNIPLFKVNHYTKKSFISNNSTIVNIIPKYSNELSYIESYRMSLFDVMYEIGGIVGIWFGWSVTSLSHFITILIRYLSKSYLLRMGQAHQITAKLKYIFQFISYILKKLNTFYVLIIQSK